MQSILPEVCVALRMFLGLPVTVAEGERTNYDEIIDNFANQVGRKKPFKISVLVDNQPLFYLH